MMTCRAQVLDPGRVFSRPCRRKATSNDRWLCWQHSPRRAQQRRMNRQARRKQRIADVLAKMESPE